MTRGAQTRAFCCCVNEFLVARQASSAVHEYASRLSCCADFFSPVFLFYSRAHTTYIMYSSGCGAYVQKRKQTAHTRDVLASGDVMVRGATPFALCIQNKLPPRATRRSRCFRALLCQKRPFYGV